MNRRKKNRAHRPPERAALQPPVPAFNLIAQGAFAKQLSMFCGRAARFGQCIIAMNTACDHELIVAMRAELVGMLDDLGIADRLIAGGGIICNPRKAEEAFLRAIAPAIEVPRATRQ